MANCAPGRRLKHLSSFILVVAAVLFNPAVAEANSAPKIWGSPPKGMVGYDYVFVPQSSDADGNSLKFSISNKPSWAAFNTSTGKISGKPGAGQYKTYSNIRISVSDGKATTSQTFSITIDRWSPDGPSGGTTTSSPPSGSNTPPKIWGTAPKGMVGYAYAFTPQSSDADGNALTFSISNKPAWAAFSSKTGKLSGTPGGGKYGTYSNIRISANDGKATTTATFSITIDPWSPDGPGSGTTTPSPPPTSPPSSGNTAPTISGTPPKGMVGHAYSFQPNASDANGDSLKFSISNKPSWASFSTSTGKISGKPGAGQYRTYSNVRITVSDGKASSYKNFNIVIDPWSPDGPGGSSGPSNSPPKIWGAPNAVANVGQTYAFTPQSSDPDGDSLKFSIANKPGWASFNTSTGKLSGTPSAGNVGTYSNIRITVSDGAQTAAIGFDIRVVASANGSITISWLPPTTNEDGSVLTNLAGFYIHYGTSSGNYTKKIKITNPSVSTYVLSNLAPDTYFLTLSAYNSDNVESDLANEAQFRID